MMRVRLPVACRFLCCLLLGACTVTSLPVNDAANVMARQELAPRGTLRAAINLGNPTLAVRDPASGEPRGVSVDLARALAKRLDVKLEFVVYTAAGKVVDAIKSGAWDIAFFAIDPVRAEDTDFSAAYLVIEGAYLVREDSPIRRNADVDVDGVRVVAARGSAYDLFLRRELKHARLVHAPSSQAVTDMMVAEKIEVAAGVRQQLLSDQKRLPGLRILDGRFMVINQAMALPKGRPAGTAYLARFVEEMKSSGFVAEALRRHGVDGAVVAPAARE